MLRLRTYRPGSVILVVMTIVLAGVSLLNLAQRGRVVRPDDGVVWVDTQRGVEAARVDPGGPAAEVGVRPGDRLLRIDGRAVDNTVTLARRLAVLGAWSQADYGMRRGVLDLTYRIVIGEESGRGAATVFQVVLGGIYLALGVFVWRRSRRASLVRLFYGFCLSSFALYVLSYSGELDLLDRVVYWIDAWAHVLTPALFVHFCLAFPGGLRSRTSRRLAAGAYAAAGAMVLVRHLAAAGGLEIDGDAVGLNGLLDRIDYGLLGAGLLAGAVVLRVSGSEAENQFVKTQRRWLSTGALWGAAPFAAFYVAPLVLLGQTPGPNHTLSIFALALIPLAFAFSVARQRFMDVELVFRRGASYTFATAALLAAFYGGVYLLSGWTQTDFGDLGPAVWIASVVLAALAYNPLRRLIQGLLDRRYYRDRYDYRRTLADFAAELSTETDPERMLEAVGDRLRRSLAVEQVAVFTREDDERFASAYSAGSAMPERLDLGFLAEDPARKGLRYRLFEQPDRESDEAVRRMGLHYYVPCRVQGRLIAWIGLGLTEGGDYLTTEDLALIEAVSGNFAIALENARLYRSLAQKANEYQRLKDYNENIVESLHVGILAVDLEDRVESWNTQLELLFGISRKDAVGRTLAELLPPALAAQCEKAKGDAGVSNIYKLAVRADEFPPEFRSSDPATLERERVLNAAIAPLVKKDFEPIGRLMIVDDVTERAELEEQVLQSDKLSSIGLLAAGVAHEVNTPLAVISSYAQMLSKQVSGDPNQEKILEKITKQTFRASEIVNSLLSFSRTSSSELAPLQVNDTIGETLSLVEPQLRKSAVQVETAFAAELPAIRGVANRLQQVILNLLLNARDAMPGGGVLRVTTEHVEDGDDQGAVRITVTDSGAGIPREKLGKIFDPFFTTKGSQGGTGLGLAVSYGIVQEHGGTMRAENSADRGAVFTIELPAVSKPIHA